MASRPLQYLTIFLTCFIDILGFGIVIPVLPLYAEHFGATAVQIGWLVGIFSLAQFFFAPIWGNVSDRVGRKLSDPRTMIGLSDGGAHCGVIGTAVILAVLSACGSKGNPNQSTTTTTLY
jgi:MFS family permease